MALKAVPGNRLAGWASDADGTSKLANQQNVSPPAPTAQPPSGERVATVRVDDSRSLPDVDLKHQTGPSVATAHVAYPAATAAKAGAFGTACGKSAQGTAYVPYP
jgi:hypothetical protein